MPAETNAFGKDCFSYFQAIIAIIAGLAAAFLVACDSQAIVVPTPTVEYVFPTPKVKFGYNVKVNTTKTQLDEAWRKWQSQRINAYEMTVDYWVLPYDPYSLNNNSETLRWTYGFRVQGETIDYLYINEQGTLETPSPDSLNFSDVSSLFSQVAYELANYDPKLTSDYSCDVNFDAEYGYPNYVDCPRSKGTKPRESMLSRTMRVSAFEVLQQTTPTIR